MIQAMGTTHSSGLVLGWWVLMGTARAFWSHRGAPLRAVQIAFVADLPTEALGTYW